MSFRLLKGKAEETTLREFVHWLCKSTKPYYSIHTILDNHAPNTRTFNYKNYFHKCLLYAVISILSGTRRLGDWIWKLLRFKVPYYISNPKLSLIFLMVFSTHRFSKPSIRSHNLLIWPSFKFRLLREWPQITFMCAGFICFWSLLLLLIQFSNSSNLASASLRRVVSCTW